ncbi:MAG: hypothetical protein HW378_207 [Anaerolineales bacterium]|nr:hypothetical protein [Anaerolineales bacterium]
MANEIPSGPANSGLKEAIHFLLERGEVTGQALQLSRRDSDPFLVLPVGYRIECVAGLFPPRLIKENITFRDADSFCRYVSVQKTPDSLVLAGWNTEVPHFLAVLDYHGRARDGQPGKPGECRHAATLQCQPTWEWQRWLAVNAKGQTQVEFVQWLEEMQGCILSPPGAELLELIQTLEGKSNVRFSSAIRLQNGRSALQYEEDVELRGVVNTEPGRIEVPAQIEAGIAPYLGCQPYSVPARLRYRIEGRKVTFTLQTIRLDRIQRDALNSLSAQVEAKTGIKPLLGSRG